MGESMENFEESNLGEFLDWNPKKKHIPNLGAYEMAIKWLLNGYTFQKQATSTWGPTKWIEMGQLPGDSR